MALTRVDSYLIDLDAIGGITFDDQAGTPAFKVDASTHRVGIGTSAPASLLDVAGDVTIADKIIHGGDTNTSIRFPEADTFTVETAGFERVRVTSSGNVGIGITNPAFELQVGSGNFGNVSGQSGVAITAASQIFNTFGTGGDLVIRAQRPTDAGGGAITLGGSTRGDFRPDSVLISTANTPRVFVNSTGNVGIGTTSPNELLHVAGVARIGANNTSDAELQIGVGATGNRNAYVDLVSDTTYTDYGLRLIRTNGGANGESLLAHRGTNVLYLNCEDAGSIGFKTNAIERGRIDSSGRFGIGTSSPISPLHIFGGTGQTTANLTDAGDRGGFLRLSTNNANAGGGGALIFSNVQGDSANSVGFAAIKGLLSDGSNNTAGHIAFSTREASANSALSERLRILDSGRVGIGTASPSFNLDVSGSGTQTIRAITTDTSGTAIGRLRAAYTGGGGGTQSAVDLRAGDAYCYLTTEGSVPLLFGINLQERARIDTSGRFGLGTSSPSAITKMSIADSTSAGIYLLRTAQGETVIENTGPLTIRQSSGNGANQNIFFKTGASVGTEVTAMTIAGSQRVGIGTTDPSTILELRTASDTQLTLSSSNNTADGRLVFKAASGTEIAGIYMQQNGDTRFYTGGMSNERLVIKTGGNVGIGNTNPTEKLDVHSTTSRALRMTSAPGVSPANLDGAEIISVLRTTAVDGLTFSSADPRMLTTIVTPRNEIGLRAGNLALIATGYISLNPNNYNTEAVRILSNGNVGIGSTNPLFKLQVLGDFQFVSTSNLGTTAGNTLTLGDITHNNGNQSYIRFKATRLANGINWTTASTKIVNVTDVTEQGYIEFGPQGGNGGIGLGNGSNEFFRINPSGNVGIGTTSPTALLNIGAASTSDINYLRVGGSEGLPQRYYRYVAVPAKATASGVADTAKSVYIGRFWNGTHKIQMYAIGSFAEEGVALTLFRDWGINAVPRIIVWEGSPLDEISYHYQAVSNDSYDVFASYTYSPALNSGDVNQLRFDITSIGNLGTFNSAASPTVPTLDASNRILVRLAMTSSMVAKIEGPAGTLLRLDGGSGGTGTRDIVFTEFNTDAFGGIIRYHSEQDRFTFGTIDFSNVIDAINVKRATGNVGIGITDPGTKLDVSGVIRSSSDIIVGGELNMMGTAADKFLDFNVDNGTTSFSVNFRTTNSDSAHKTALRFVRSGTLEAFFDNSKKFETTSTGATVTGTLVQTSDSSLKKNVSSIPDALGKVLGLRGVYFDWKDAATMGCRRNVGVIAQETESVLPEVVTEAEDGTKSVAYGNIVALLIEAIKDQQRQIEELKSEIRNFRS